MPNHIHLIWQIQDKHQKARVQQSFLKYMAQQIKLTMLTESDRELENYKVKASDRQYQFLGEKPFEYRLVEQAMFLQKLNYIHNNPTQLNWRLCEYPEEYKYSSSKFYEKEINEFGFRSQYVG